MKKSVTKIFNAAATAASTAFFALAVTSDATAATFKYVGQDALWIAAELKVETDDLAAGGGPALSSIGIDDFSYLSSFSSFGRGGRRVLYEDFTVTDIQEGDDGWRIYIEALIDGEKFDGGIVPLGLDDLEIVTEKVPEPSSAIALGALALGALATKLRRRS